MADLVLVRSMPIAITSTPLQITFRVISAVLLALAVVLVAIDLFASLHLEANSAPNGSSGFMMVFYIRPVTILSAFGGVLLLALSFFLKKSGA